MKKLWFKRKSYGWGWTPATWQGWVVLFAFVIFEVWNFLRIDALSHSVSDTLMNFLPETLLATFLLVGICYLTGETPRWQWGNTRKK